MQLRLLEPNARNWIIVAEELNDPQEWNRFVPCHTHDSERFLFESTVRTLDASIKLAVCKELLTAGVCAFEYSWDTDEDALLQHAMKLADRLAVDLQIGDEPPAPTSKSAA